MADLLAGFSGTDEFEGGIRQVSFADGVLTVVVSTREHGDYAGRFEEKNFLLTEVVRRWAPVEGGDTRG